MKIRIELSLFNGMSIASMAFKDAGIEVEKCYSSEIDKYANKATDAMFPEINQLGDITKWRDWDIDWSCIDFITGGFPCQSWSMAGKQLGDKDERGMLFWTMLDIIKHVQHYNPSVNFMIENVRMKKEFEAYITTHTENALGVVHKTLINSALVSAQNRNRYYWTSFPVIQPKDKGILLRDIIENVELNAVDRDKSHCIDANYFKGGNLKSYFEKHRRQLVFRPCELRETKKPMTLIEWGEETHPDEFLPMRFHDGSPLGYGHIDLEELADRYMQGGGKGLYKKVEGHEFDYDIYLNKFMHENKFIKHNYLCHHVATATDIKGNESIKRVYADDGKSPTLTTMEGGHRQPKVFIGAIRGRYIVNGKRADQKVKSLNGITIQRLEVNKSEKSNTLTTVQKDNVVITDFPKYRKLTPRECFRLQAVPEHYIETLLSAGISNTQLYKMCGNSFTMKVISHILCCYKKANN